MKRIATAQAPQRFLDWQAAHPTGTWDEFRDHNRDLPDGTVGAANEVLGALLSAQHHLCAYCEIDLVAPLYAQVEHWRAKDPAKDDGHNWGLDFTNFMAACEGGVRKDVDPKGARWLDPIRETQHCGQKKANDVKVEELLDPRHQVPAGPVWTFDGDGRMGVSGALDPALGARADATIQRLNLDSRVLRRQRAALWRDIDATVTRTWEALGDDDEAYAAAFDAVAPDFLQIVDGRLHNFWSTARAYFGPVAERWLSDHPELLP